MANEIGLRQALREAQADAEHMQALARQNTELLSVIAHDLRTSLQVLNLMASQDGAGLGLHIVRALGARNDGTVELSSAPGAGAAFTIRLPCAVVH